MKMDNLESNILTGRESAKKIGEEAGMGKSLEQYSQMMEL